MRNNFFLIIVSLFLVAACHTPGKTDLIKEKEAIKKTDIDFSAFSQQKGMKAAFIQYLDSGGVLLRPDHYPIIGKEAVQYLQKVNDSSFTLTWEPAAAEMSGSGDLGYTYGIYTFRNKDTAFQGTYVSIWKKQPDGNWKFVLDTGNPGVAKQK
jgi:ketosteroid isomerase-like protein